MFQIFCFLLTQTIHSYRSRSSVYLPSSSGFRWSNRQRSGHWHWCYWYWQSWAEH